MNVVYLGTLNCGDSFSYAGYDWTIIHEESKDGIRYGYCLCNELVDSRNIIKGGIPFDTTTYIDSDKNKFFWFLCKEFGNHLLLNNGDDLGISLISRDITADDGTTRIIESCIKHPITILTANEYRQYREYISAPVNQGKDGYFTITPRSYSETIYKNDWMYVMPNGVLTYKNSADMDAESLYTFRPMICLDGRTMVTVNKVTEEEIKRITDQFNAIEDKYGYDGCKYLLDILNRMYNR